MICNLGVVGSNPTRGSRKDAEKLLFFESKLGKYQSGQMGQTVNLLSFDFGGSNPSLPTFLRLERSLVFCGSSSVDRALAFQAEGRGFEPRLPLFFFFIEEIEENDYNLNIPRYVDTFEESVDGCVDALSKQLTKYKEKLRGK